MPVLALFGARLVAARLRLVAAVAKSVERVPPVLRTLGPYAVIELVLPGGSLLALPRADAAIGLAGVRGAAWLAPTSRSCQSGTID